MGHITGRRALLRGAAILTAVPVATAAGTVFEVAPEPAETPIKAIFREWAAYWQWVNGDNNRHWTDDEFDQHYAGLNAIEDRIEAETPTNFEDLALQHAAMTSFGVVCLDNAWERKVQAFARVGVQ